MTWQLVREFGFRGSRLLYCPDPAGDHALVGICSYNLFATLLTKGDRMLTKGDRMRNRYLVVLLLLSCAAPAFAAENPYLYKVSLVQAAPGKLLDLIDLYKARAAANQAAGDELPLWMRHSQGDHWDLMILFPMGSYTDFYQAGRISKRKQSEQASKLEEKIRENTAWQEDLFAYGPPLAVLRKAFANGSFFHVEMFVCLPRRFGVLDQA